MAEQNNQDLTTYFDDLKSSEDGSEDTAIVDASVGDVDVQIAEPKKGKGKGKKSKEQAMLSTEFLTWVRENPEEAAKLNSRSNDFEVVKVIGFGDKGNVVADYSSGSRELTLTSRNVGYKIKNLSDTPINYTTEEWTQTGDDTWESQVVEKVFNPGEEICLTRKYMALFCSPVEISFKLRNGKLTKSSNKSMRDTPVVTPESLEAFYFNFNKRADGTRISVNDDEVKLNIGVRRDDGKWVVKPEYEKTFGYLNVKPVIEKKKKPDYSAQDAYALAARKCKENGGLK